MTLTFQGYDQSQEVSDFFKRIEAMQGHVTAWKNVRGHNATIELTAHVPEQLELLTTNQNHDPNKKV